MTATRQNGMEFAAYAAIPAINATALKAGAKSMLHMRHIMTGGAKEETSAMSWGRLIHAAILERDRTIAQMAVFDGKDKRASGWKQFAAECETTGKTPLLKAELSEIMAVSDAVHGNSEARRLVTESAHEVSLTWQHTTLGDCKARLDGLTSNRVVEVKTAKDVSGDRLFRQCVGLKYDIQFGFYSIATEGMPVTVIAIESEPPYDVCVWPIPKRMIKQGTMDAERIGAMYRECEKRGVFPGQQPDGPEELPVADWYGEEAVVMGFEELAESQL